ncbi:Transposase DDE domain protein [Symmachiella dynata]|uniref:Transposase DDE domain protein n=1 Tax=Symmachiella dynata TaxID=2527995 RepID=A0A517ZT43_9PLAN|nr:IS4 family transposase [Symmachiella dynata]QDU45658.1 Transposase DDE domain protein [Symmachiella dynata]
MANERSNHQSAVDREWPVQVIGGKYVRLLARYLQKLRDEDAHGNRRLYLDDVFVAYLLAFFNPSIRSLRTVEDFSQTRQAQQHLSVRKICKSTLSDFNKIADPQRLEPILQALRCQLTRKHRSRSNPADGLSEMLERTVAVDGTFIPAVAEVAWAIANSNNHGTTRHRARLDARLNVATWLPEALVVPAVGQSESDSAIEHLQEGCIYLYDRGYMSFALLAAHYHKPHTEKAVVKSSFVVRFKPAAGNSSDLKDATDCPLSDADRAAGVVSDRVGNFISATARRTGISRLRLREVIVTYEEQGQPKTLRLITNLHDVSAKTIGLLYRHRWQVELFFRWFKSFGNFGHLISHQREGVLAHLYVTIIAVLLMYLHTGYRPSKYLFALVSQVAVGGATLDEIMPILQERERQNELARQSAARRRAKKGR